MLERDDLGRLFQARHRIFTPQETIDGQPDERLAVMEGIARTLFHAAGSILVNCLPNDERDIAIRRMHEAMLYAFLSLLL